MKFSFEMKTIMEKTHVHFQMIEKKNEEIFKYKNIVIPFSSSSAWLHEYI